MTLSPTGSYYSESTSSSPMRSRVSGASLEPLVPPSGRSPRGSSPGPLAAAAALAPRPPGDLLSRKVQLVEAARWLGLDVRVDGVELLRGIVMEAEALERSAGEGVVKPDCRTTAVACDILGRLAGMMAGRRALVGELFDRLEATLFCDTDTITAARTAVNVGIRWVATGEAEPVSTRAVAAARRRALYGADQSPASSRSSSIVSPEVSVSMARRTRTERTADTASDVILLDRWLAQLQAGAVTRVPRMSCVVAQHHEAVASSVPSDELVIHSQISAVIHRWGAAQLLAIPAEYRRQVPYFVVGRLQRFEMAQVQEKLELGREITSGMEKQYRAMENILSMINELTRGSIVAWCFAYWKISFCEGGTFERQLKFTQGVINAPAFMQQRVLRKWRHMIVAGHVQRLSEENRDRAAEAEQLKSRIENLEHFNKDIISDLGLTGETLSYLEDKLAKATRSREMLQEQIRTVKPDHLKCSLNRVLAVIFGLAADRSRLSISDQAFANLPKDTLRPRTKTTTEGAVKEMKLSRMFSKQRTRATLSKADTSLTSSSRFGRSGGVVTSADLCDPSLLLEHGEALGHLERIPPAELLLRWLNMQACRSDKRLIRNLGEDLNDGVAIFDVLLRVAPDVVQKVIGSLEAFYAENGDIVSAVLECGKMCVESLGLTAEVVRRGRADLLAGFLVDLFIARPNLRPAPGSPLWGHLKTLEEALDTGYVTIDPKAEATARGRGAFQKFCTLFSKEGSAKIGRALDAVAHSSSVMDSLAQRLKSHSGRLYRHRIRGQPRRPLRETGTMSGEIIRHAFHESMKMEVWKDFMRTEEVSARGRQARNVVRTFARFLSEVYIHYGLSCGGECLLPFSGIVLLYQDCKLHCNCVGCPLHIAELLYYEVLSEVPPSPDYSNQLGLDHHGFLRWLFRLAAHHAERPSRGLPECLATLIKVHLQPHACKRLTGHDIAIFSSDRGVRGTFVEHEQVLRLIFEEYATHVHEPRGQALPPGAPRAKVMTAGELVQMLTDARAFSNLLDREAAESIGRNLDLRARARAHHPSAACVFEKQRGGQPHAAEGRLEVRRGSLGGRCPPRRAASWPRGRASQGAGLTLPEDFCVSKSSLTDGFSAGINFEDFKDGLVAATLYTNPNLAVSPRRRFKGFLTQRLLPGLLASFHGRKGSDTVTAEDRRQRERILFALQMCAGEGAGSEVNPMEKQACAERRRAFNVSSQVARHAAGLRARSAPPRITSVPRAASGWVATKAFTEFFTMRQKYKPSAKSQAGLPARPLKAG